MDNRSDNSNGNMPENAQECQPGPSNQALPTTNSLPRPDLPANPQPNPPANPQYPECPGAPSKRRPRRVRVVRETLQDEPNCSRNLNFRCLGNDAGVACGRITKPLAPRKKVPRNKLSLRLNRGVLPRPFQSRARRDIMRFPALGRNIVRIMGVDDPLENWIDLDDIHRNPLNRAGNPQAPRAPRKSRGELALRFGQYARRMVPRQLEFDTDSEESESSDSENDSDDSGYGGRPWNLIFNV